MNAFRRHKTPSITNTTALCHHKALMLVIFYALCRRHAALLFNIAFLCRHKAPDMFYMPPLRCRNAGVYIDTDKFLCHKTQNYG